MDPCKTDNKGPPCCCVRAVEDDLATDRTWRLLPHWIGNSILFCGNKHLMFPFHCLMGPHWMIMLSSYAQILIYSLLFIFLVTENLPYGFTLAAVISLCVLLATFSATAFSDPGIVYKTPSNDTSVTVQPVAAEDGRALEVQRLIECSQCKIMRPNTARHCNFCGVCVDKVCHSVLLYYYYAFLLYD